MDGQNSSTITKPSSGTTSTTKPSSSNSSNTKPSSGSSSISSSKPVENNVVVLEEQNMPIEENNIEENANQTEVINQEEINEEILNDQEEVIDKESNNAEMDNMETVKTTKSNGKIIIITTVGIIALIIMFIGIGVSKNILRK